MLGALGDRIADLDLLGRGLGDADRLVVLLGARHEHARRRIAGLAGVDEAAACTPPATAFCRSASSRTMLADLPPSSCATRLTVSAAALATAMPARVEPVNDIMSMPGWEDSASPTVGPSPLTRLNTPGGTPASSRISAKSTAFSGATSERLQHHGAAGGERRRDLAGDLVDRPVPRRDEAADADRLAHDRGRAADLLELEILQHGRCIG